MSPRQILGLVTLIAGVAYIEWLMVPPPIAARPAALVDEPWELAGQPRYDTAQALATLNKASLWGKLADNAVPRVVDAGWRFVGTMARARERYVIVKVGDQAEQKLAPGDKLPDGTSILAIENDRICVMINNKKRSLAIYAQGLLSGEMSSVAR